MIQTLATLWLAGAMSLHLNAVGRFLASTFGKVRNAR